MYLFNHRNSLVCFIAFLSLFYPPHTYASQTLFLNPLDVEESDELLVEYPDYGKLAKKSPPKLQAKAIQQIFNNKNCESTDLPFQKMEDPNVHPYFPVLQHDPVIGDHWGLYFLKEKKTGSYFLFNWAPDQFPIRFHLTKALQPYREWIQDVVDNVNQTARTHDVIPEGQSLIELSKDTKNVKDEQCDLHLIMGADQDDATLMRTYMWHVNDDADRLGEIIDADIVIYLDTVKNSFKKDLKKAFQWYLTHEFLHTLGLDHNFALGTVMSYNFDSIATTDLEDVISDYEIDVLKYLFHQEFVPKPWALIRPRNGFGNGQKYIPEGMYKLEPKDQSIICNHLSNEVEKRIPITSILMNLAYETRHGVDWINLSFSHFSNEHDWVPPTMESKIPYFGVQPITGNLDTSFDNKDPRFSFRPSFLENLNNRFSAHIDTGFAVLDPPNPNHLTAVWDVKNELDQVIAECKLSTEFDLTRVEK